MEKIGHFSEPDAKRIAKFFRRRGDRKQDRPRRPRKRVQSPTKGNVTIQAPTGGLPPADNYAFTPTTCTVLVEDSGTWKDSGTSVEVYNPATTAQATGGLRLGWAAWDGTRYVLISVLCNDTRTFVAPELIQ